MDKDIVAEAKEAFKECEEAERDNRDEALDDIRFARLGEQWPSEVMEQRKRERRPCLTINKLPAFLRQVINETRQNKPSIKVHPVDSNADVKTAEIISGLIRNIEYTSNADVAYDTAADFAATMGFGYLRIGLDYACDDTFDMDLKIDRVSNPFTVYGDPYSTSADSSDWDTSFITDMLSDDRFEQRFPEAEKIDWQADGDSNADWFEDKQIRVAEYWKRTKVKKNLLKLSDGNIVYEDFFLQPDPQTGLSMAEIAQAQGVQVVGQRLTDSFEVKQYTLNAKEVLEETDWAGRYIPIVPVYGEEVNVEGKRHFLSLIRQSKDAQRMFNYWRTATTELVALAPKAPYIGEQGAFDVDNKWTTANTDTHAYLEYKKGSQMPQRQMFAGVPAGALQEALNASDDMKAIMGLYDAALGARSNETSGKAIIARQREGDVSTFHFVDNVTRAIRHTGRILIDMIPHVYSEERVVRVLGEDGTPQTVTLNKEQPQIDPKTGQPMMQQTPQGLQPIMAIYNVSAGKYDLTVTSGPSYTTRRQEAAEHMTQLIQSFPQSAAIIAPRLAKNLDWPEADEIAADFEKISPLNQPPPDPMKDPKVMVAMKTAEFKQQEAAADMQLKQQEAGLNQQNQQAELQMSREDLEIKKQNAELDAAIKIANFKIDMMSKDSTQQQNIVEDKPDSGAILAQAVTEAAKYIGDSLQAVAAQSAQPKQVTMVNSQGKQLTATVQ
jgi:hypothetical protein